MTKKSEIRSQGKAPRPAFFTAEPAADRVFAIVNTLVTELAVLRERQDTIVRLAEERGLFTSADIEDYSPDEEVDKARRNWREAYLARVYAILEEDIEVARQQADTAGS